MTSRDSTTIPQKDIRYCPDTRDYEVTVNGQIIGYAPTMIRSYELANEYIYQQLTRDHLDPADLPQDDAEALLFTLQRDIIADPEPAQVEGAVACLAVPAVNRLVATLTDEDLATFWEQVQQTDGCWNWMGSLNPQWYGIYKGQLAHRVAYVLAYGLIPPTLMVCHHCDHPPCVRPDHLFLGTASDNRRDYARKGHRAQRAPFPETLSTRFWSQVAKKHRRDQRIYSRYRLWRAIGLDRYTLYGIMSGHLKEVSPEVIAVLCAYFGCTEQDLLGPE